MVISVQELLVAMPDSGQDQAVLTMKLEAIEELIRRYTNNNFQNRNVRCCGPSEGRILACRHPFMRVGDTIEVSGINAGVYTINSVTERTITVDREMLSAEKNIVTKVEYPAAVKQGVINLMIWEKDHRQKVGVKTETLSRHTVTYYDQDAANQTAGYPVALMGFLKPYMKARF